VRLSRRRPSRCSSPRTVWLKTDSGERNLKFSERPALIDHGTGALTGVRSNLPGGAEAERIVQDRHPGGTRLRADRHPPGGSCRTGSGTRRLYVVTESSRDRPRWGSSTQRPDILERGPDGLYRYLVASEDMRQALFDYLACDRVAAAWARKRSAKDKDLARARWLSP
jgi:hypothetical protein